MPSSSVLGASPFGDGVRILSAKGSQKVDAVPRENGVSHCGDKALLGAVVKQQSGEKSHKYDGPLEGDVGDLPEESHIDMFNSHPQILPERGRVWLESGGCRALGGLSRPVPTRLDRIWTGTDFDQLARDPRILGETRPPRDQTLGKFGSERPDFGNLGNDDDLGAVIEKPHMHKDPDSTDQRWKFVHGGLVVNRLSGKCLSANATRASVEIRDCGVQHPGAQSWAFVSITQVATAVGALAGRPYKACDENGLGDVEHMLAGDLALAFLLSACPGGPLRNKYAIHVCSVCRKHCKCLEGIEVEYRSAS